MHIKLKIDSPESYLSRFLDVFRIDGSLRLAGTALFSTMLSALLSYHLLIIYGHGNADAVCEGLVCYNVGSADWALGCGRWLTRYMNALSGDVIMPGVWITLYMLCVFCSAMLLVKLWKIKSPVAVCLISVLLAVNPTVIEQSLLQYMFMAWGLSNLLGVLFVYLNCQENKWLVVLSPICIMLAFGLYQSSVGLLCLCFCMTLIIMLTDGMEIKRMFLLVLRFGIMSLIGVAMYFAALRYEVFRHDIDVSGRMQEFSLGGIFSSLIDSVKDAYVTFFQYFAEPTFHRWLWYSILAAILIICFAVTLYRTVRAGKHAQGCFALLLFLLIPAFANIAKIIFPYNITVTIMEYQNMFMFPFLFALMERTPLRLPSLHNLGRILAGTLSVILCWTYIVSANATYLSYELTYRHLNFMTTSILNDVYNMPEYDRNDTIAFAGFVDDSYLRENFSTYEHAYGMYSNLTFWIEPLGIRNSRHNYLMNYFGIESGYVFALDYNAAVRSEEFKNMPVYPGVGAIREFPDNLIIVKLSDDPPIFE